MIMKTYYIFVLILGVFSTNERAPKALLRMGRDALHDAVLYHLYIGTRRKWSGGSKSYFFNKYIEKIKLYVKSD